MKELRVNPGARVKLHRQDSDSTGDYANAQEADPRTEHLREKLDKLQERLYAEGRRAVLVVLQGMDTSGKDGTIRHDLSGVNPQGCTVTSFKAPTPQEKAHDFLWRAHAACPPRGHIGIFNRSHYEDVLISRVHGWINQEEAQRRLQQIRDFEKMLAKNGTRVLKFFLHISKGEQKKRLLERMKDPDKHWKYSPQDIKERSYWSAYQRTFEEVLSATSTREAPWFVVPANHKWFRNLVVATSLVRALEEMDPGAPKRRGLDWAKLRREMAKA